MSLGVKLLNCCNPSHSPLQDTIEDAWGDRHERGSHIIHIVFNSPDLCIHFLYLLFEFDTNSFTHHSHIVFNSPELCTHFLYKLFPIYSDVIDWVQIEVCIWMFNFDFLLKSVSKLMSCSCAAVLFVAICFCLSLMAPACVCETLMGAWIATNWQMWSWAQARATCILHSA